MGHRWRHGLSARLPPEDHLWGRDSAFVVGGWNRNLKTERRRRMQQVRPRNELQAEQVVQHGLLHGSASLGFRKRVAGGSKSPAGWCQELRLLDFQENDIRAGGTDEPRVPDGVLQHLQPPAVCRPEYHSGVAHLRGREQHARQSAAGSVWVEVRVLRIEREGGCLTDIPLPVFRSLVTTIESNAPTTGNFVLCSLSRVRVSPLTMFLSYFAASSFVRYALTHWTRRIRRQMVRWARQIAAIRRWSDTRRNFVGNGFG